MRPDQSTLQSRARGTLPDKFWYQFDDGTVQEKYMEQKMKMHENLVEQAGDDGEEIHIASEVKIKK